MKTKRIFISYKRFDKKLNNNDETVARKLYDKLRSAGFDCWMDQMDIPIATESWANDIVTAIEKCDLVIMVISKYAQASKTIRLKELRVISDYHKRIIPFRIDDSKLEKEFQWELSSCQWVEAWDDYESKIDELISKMRLELGDPKAPRIEQPSFKNEMANNSLAKDSQKELFKKENELKTQTFNINGVTFNMVYVEGGNFTMGANEEDEKACDDEKPAHEVMLSDYWIGETQVTQALWEAVMGNDYPNPSRTNRDTNCPVEYVSWNDCQKFIERINEELKEVLNETNREFDLPTEAQWEFAARGGNEGKEKNHKYSGTSHDLKIVAWYTENSEDKTHPVAQKKPNELGLYDMSGNVWEWCHDWYGPYSIEAQTDPEGPGPGKRHSRVRRGSGWGGDEGYCRVTYRRFDDPSVARNYVGFRLALRIKKHR